VIFIINPTAIPPPAHRQARAAGEWVAERDFTRKKKVGFRLSSLYSPWVKFGQMAVEFLKAKPFPEKLQSSVNPWLGEPWKQVIVMVSESDILQARTDLPPQTVPDEAVALTARIDGQKYGFWFVVRARARDYTSWNIHHKQFSPWE
jgi:phage terminase large subunit GpA-like protein